MKPRIPALVTCVVVAFVFLSPAFAGTGWRAGLATAKITPQTPIPMAGYGGRVKPFERVEQDIYAKALLLADASGQRAVIITTDLEGMPGWFTDGVAQDITAKTGLAREQILLSWSHSHAGPALSRNVRPGPGGNATDAQNLVAYTKWLQGQLVDLVVRAGAKLDPVTLSHGRGVAHFVMNRREFTPKGIILGVNPTGPVDRSVPVLRVDSPDGQPRAILFGAACHNTTLGGKNYDLCGDYAGFAQHALQEKFPGVQAMFMIGCGGDANPYPRDTLELTRAHGVALATEVARVCATKLRPVSGPLKVAFARADLPLQSFTKEQLQPLAASSPNWQIGNARQMLATLERGEKLPATAPAPLAVWQFGADLTLVAISGEAVYDYVPLVEKALGPLNLWIAAYTNDDFGYLPSARVIREGGYETRGLNSGDGWFAPEAETAVAAKLVELAKKVGRL